MREMGKDLNSALREIRDNIEIAIGVARSKLETLEVDCRRRLIHILAVADREIQRIINMKDV